MNAKKILALIIALAMVFTLAACGKKAGEPAKAGAPVPTPASQAPAPAAQTPAQTQPADTQPDGMASAGGKGDMPEETYEDRLTIFAKFLDEICVEMMGEYDGCDPRLDLVYLDDDDLPELALAQDWYHAAGVRFFTVIGGEVKDIGEEGYGFGEYGTAYYKERGSIVESGYYGMGALSVELFKVNEDASIEPLKSWYEYENIDWDSNISEFIYMVDGVPVEEEEYNDTVSEWSDMTDSVFSYEYALSYADQGGDTYGALMYLYMNPTDYSGYGGISDIEYDDINYEQLVGEWKLVSFNTEGYEGIASEDGLDDRLTFYDDRTVYIYEKLWDDKPLEVRDVPVDWDEWGYLSFVFNDTRVSGNQEIEYSLIALEDEGMTLHVSSMFEYGDGTYGGSELFYTRMY